MELNAIVLELMSRIQTLESKVATLEARMEASHAAASCSRKPLFPADKISDKYIRLGEYLYQNWERKITLSYREIEEILEFPLPETAHNFPQSYWANTKTHSYASSWLALGYKAKVNYETKKVTFERNLF